MTTVFEEKNIHKAIMRAGLPAMLGVVTTLIYNIADTYFVTLTKDPAQIAAVTLCAPILLIIMSIAAIFGTGGNSVIARLLGEGRKNDAGSTLNFCVYGMIATGIIVLILGLLFLNPFATLAGSDADNISFTQDYLKYIFIGAPFIMAANGFVNLFRSIGLIKQSTIGLIIGNGINIVLDFIFIVILHLGAGGAAMATSIGFLCSTIYGLAVMIQEERKGNPLIPLTPKHWKPNKAMVSSVIKIGIPGALITLMMSVGNIVLNNYIGMYGSGAVASYGIAYKIDMIPILLSVGLAQGVAPLIGYCYGAGEKKRMKNITLYAAGYGCLIGLAFTILFAILSKPLASIFMHEEALINQTAFFLKILLTSATLLGIINVVTSYFQALGKAFDSLILIILRNLVLFIPGVMLLNSIWHLNGCIAAQPVVEALLAIISVIMYIRSTKKI